MDTWYSPIVLKVHSYMPLSIFIWIKFDIFSHRTTSLFFFVYIAIRNVSSLNFFHVHILQFIRCEKVRQFDSTAAVDTILADIGGIALHSCHIVVAFDLPWL